MRRGGANEGARAVREQRGKPGKYSVIETNEEPHQEGAVNSAESPRSLRMQVGPAALHPGGPLDVPDSESTPRQLALLHFSISACSLLVGMISRIPDKTNVLTQAVWILLSSHFSQELTKICFMLCN